MKKITVFSLTIAFIIGSCARNKPVETTVLGMGTDYMIIPDILNGKVKEIKELNYWAAEKDGKITRGDIMTKKDIDSIQCTPDLVAYFDDNGMLSKYEQLDGEKVILSRILTIENGKWNRIEDKIKDSTTSIFIPQYDDSGYFAGGNSYRPLVDTLTGRIVISHNSNGNYTKYEFYDYKNKKTGSIDFTPDEKGNNLEIKWFNKGDTLTSTMINTYDQDGNLIKQLLVNEKPKSTSTWDYKDLKSDDHGNVVEYYSNVDNGKFKIFTERSFIYY